MQESSAMGRYIYEMAISEVNMNSIPVGRFSPPATAQPAAQKPKAPMSAEEALNILKLVNVGKQVLNPSSLNKPPQVMILIAESIIDGRKNGIGVEFENGRIHLSEELFESIVRSCEKGADNPERVPVKPAEGSLSFGAAASSASSEEELRKERTGQKSPSEKASEIYSEETVDDQPINLSSPQAYCILIDITAPDGGRYMIHIKDKYGDSPEERKELEKGLRTFWKDFGQNAAINALRNRFIIEPAMLVGGMVNPEVSKKLVWIYVSQSTTDKVSRGNIQVMENAFIIRPSVGNMEITLSNKNILEFLVNLTTSKTDSGIIRTKKSPYSSPWRNTS